MRKLLVHGEKKFMLTIPDDAELTFGPWSPPNSKEKSWDHEAKRGTLRVYTAKKAGVLGVFSGVTSFRDMSLGYAEEVAKEEGDAIWKDDEKGYFRKSSVRRTKEWREDPAALPEPTAEAESDPDTGMPF